MSCSFLLYVHHCEEKHAKFVELIKHCWIFRWNSWPLVLCSFSLWVEDRDIDCVSVLTWSVHVLLTAGLNGSHLLIRVDVWEVLAKIVTHCCKIKRWWSHPRQSLPDCFYSHSPASFSKLWLPICNVCKTVNQNITAYVAHKSDENYGKHGVICLLAGGCFHKKAFSLSHRGMLLCSLQSRSLQLVRPTWVCRNKVDLLMI